MLEATAGKIDLFSEFLYLSRFPEKSHIDRMARYLAEKYADHRPDVIIAVGEAAISFIVNHRDRIAPEAKIIFCCYDSPSKMNLPSDVVGVFSELGRRKF